MKVYVHWMNLMKTEIIIKFQSFEILKERVTRQRTHFLNHLTKKSCSMGSKYVKCKSHVKEIILQKNMFGCPLKFILGFFAFLVINQNTHT
jgi:hypothetical protein